VAAKACRTLTTAELSKDQDGSSGVTPEALRNEAAEAEQMARVVSYRQDKLWLIAKAAELRRLAERMETGAQRTQLLRRGQSPPDAAGS